jgi:signal transduction histidine kinase
VKLLRRLSIRTRLFVVYVAILMLGFGVLALFAGRQIASGGREDYEQRLMSEVKLTAQAVADKIGAYTAGYLSEAELKAVFSSYETQINGVLTLIVPQGRRFDVDGDHDTAGRMGARNPPEIESALHDSVTLDERLDASSVETLYTAASVVDNNQMLGLLQLAVPVSNLQIMIVRRWLELGLMIAVIALLGIGAAFWLARSIIQPLYQLRESANRLSQGDFSHRVCYANSDEIGEVAQAFNEMATQVVSMLDEQRAFASNTSHEFRTPLTTIRLRTEALRYDSSLDADTARRYVEEIDDEARRLGDLVEELTLLSRFDAGRAELGYEQIDMSRFAISLRDRMLPTAQEKGITLSLALPPEGIIVRASLTHLSILFRNILDNAIKYTPAGGQVLWTIEAADAAVRHTIRDTGHGIEAEYLPHLFERFFRADKARSRDVAGTGLGLALVKSIVEAYRGSIAVESAGLDQGTTTTVTLPRSPPE